MVASNYEVPNEAIKLYTNFIIVTSQYKYKFHNGCKKKYEKILMVA